MRRRHTGVHQTDLAVELRARRGNKGAFIRFTGGDMAPNFTTYPASPHPPVRPMAYASFMGGMFGM